MDRFENSMYEAIFRSPNQNEETKLREWERENARSWSKFSIFVQPNKELKKFEKEGENSAHSILKTKWLYNYCVIKKKEKKHLGNSLLLQVWSNHYNGNRLHYQVEE